MEEIFNFEKALENISKALETSANSKAEAESIVLKGLYSLSLNPQRKAVQFLISLLAEKRFNKIRAKVAETVKAFSNFEKAVSIKSKSGSRWVVITTDEQPLKFSEPVREFFKAQSKKEWTEDDYNEALRRFNKIWEKRLKKSSDA